MTEKRYRIVLLISSPILREGMRSVIRSSGLVAGEIRAFDSAEALTLQSSEPSPEIIVADPACLIQNGKEFTILHQRYPDAGWIALLTMPMSAGLRSKFDHHLDLGAGSEEIREALVRAGGKSGIKTRESDSAVLSERETEVLRLLAEGLSHKAIGDRLHISIHTVISHRKSISAKTGIKSNAGLTIYAITHRIVSMETLNAPSTPKK